MKSATLSAGLVAALLCPTSVFAGEHKEPKCPKTARGTNRVTCFLEVEHTDMVVEKDGHHKRGHKNKDIETSRTIKVYAWSFFWNYIIKDDCPKTDAYLTSVLPSLGIHHHGVKCKVEVRWTPDKGDDHGDKDKYYDQYHNTPWNVSWDYAGDGHIDGYSLPAKMVWPLPASFDRPEDYTKSHELGVKYELANHDDMTRLDIHSGKNNDFSNSWGHGKKHWYDEYKQEDNGHGNNNKRGHKDKEVKAPKMHKDHSRFTGHYNTKGLHSCWVFEKFHVFSREYFINGKGHGHHDGIENYTSPVIPQHHHYRWSTCEPHLPVCLEEHCEGDSCEKKNDCEDDSCDSKQSDCHDGSCDRKQQNYNNCHGESCDGRGQVATDCHGGSCDRKQQDSHHNQHGSHHNQQNGNNCHGESCNVNNHKQQNDNCHGESCGNQHGVSNKNNCHDGSCEHKREDCSTESCHDDGCKDDDCSDDGSDDDCEDDCDDDESSDGSDDDCEDDCSDDDGHDDDCDC